MCRIHVLPFERLDKCEVNRTPLSWRSPTKFVFMAKYNSYERNKGGGRRNHINQRFMADCPSQKIGTDVTEVRLGSKTKDERLYLSIFTDFIIESLLPVLKMTKDTGYLSTIHSD